MKYVTLESSNDYFSMRIGSDNWFDSSNQTQERAINHAERVLERISYKGTRVTAENAFPRGEQLQVPQRFIEAVYEEALSLIECNNNETDLADLHVTSSSVAGFQTNVNEKTERPWVLCGLTSPLAWSLIAPYILDAKSFRIVPS